VTIIMTSLIIIIMNIRVKNAFVYYTQFGPLEIAPCQVTGRCIFIGKTLVIILNHRNTGPVIVLKANIRWKRGP